MQTVAVQSAYAEMPLECEGPSTSFPAGRDRRAVRLHPLIDVVSFTGSTQTGRAFLRYSAESNLKNIVLE
jgi:4-(gamma-glutamylamino)butanal dehydrogenase